MAHPRFLYVRGTIVDERPLPAWPGFGEPLRGDVAADGSWVAWRMLGRNNHELARSVLVYADVPACTAAARALKEQSGLAELRIGPATDGGRWVWRVYHEDHDVAIASRSYSRQRECHYSLDQFRASLPEAATGDLRLFDLGQRRLVDPLVDPPGPVRPVDLPVPPPAGEGRMNLLQPSAMRPPTEAWCPF